MSGLSRMAAMAVLLMLRRKDRLMPILVFGMYEET